MATSKTIPTELLEQLRSDRDKIAVELPELKQHRQRLDHAAAEESLTGSLRRAIHGSGRPLQKIATDVGVDVYLLCDFLEGTATLSSDVLDRLAQASGATIQLQVKTST